jgi:hypothetical protein
MSYRWTTAFGLITLLQTIVAERIYPYQASSTTNSVKLGEVSLDPCFMWSQTRIIARLGVFAWLASLGALIVYGVRNRPAPVGVPIVNLFTLGIIVNDSYWQLSHCSTGPVRLSFVVWIVGMVVMGGHHLVQRSTART